MAADLFAGLRVDGARANANGMTVIGRPRRWGALRDRDTGPRAAKAQPDPAAKWLRNAMLALAVLAIAAAIVSWTAQYRMVLAVKHLPAIAALEAAIPDAAAMIFASLGIALALHGKRAIRARVLNVAAVATSVLMNALAAGHGWRNLAIWIMPPLAYALASDTLIGVIRAWSIARQKALDEALADDDAGPLAVLAGVALWLLRLVLAPPSTVRGFRSWVVAEVRVAPGRTAGQLAGPALALAPAPAATRRAAGPARDGTKTARFLALVQERHGALGALPLADVSRVCAELAGDVGLNAGAARTALRAAVLAGQNGGGSA
jgi:hypothetical protein